MDDDPATDILEATYRALCREGYADLTVRDVAVEADRSTATIHYHYDSKDALFAEFLAYLHERQTARLAAIDDGTPRERLSALVDEVFADGAGDASWGFHTAMLEVAAQAPYDDDIRAHVARFDDALYDHVRDVLEAGVETGDFAPTVDPAAAAEFLVTAFAGVRARRAAVGESNDRLREATTRYTETHLVAEGSTEAAH